MNIYYRYLAIILCQLLANQAWAGSAYIYEMGSPTDVGTAGAGMTVKAQNAGIVFGNPAGMTRFDQPELLAAGVGLYLNAAFKPNDNTMVEGSNGQSHELFASGQVAYIHPVSDNIKVSISAQNYFGLTLDWSSQWVGRYDSVSETLIAPQVQPTVAYKVNDWLSVGAVAALTMGYISDKKRVANVDLNRGDGKLRYSDTHYAVQWNLGFMLEPKEQTRVGIRYLGETDLDFQDGLNLSNVGPVVGQAKDDKLDLDINMPEAVNVGVFH